MSKMNATYHSLMATVRAFFSAERGATATEYSLLVGLIALVIVAGVTLFGGNLDAWFTALAGKVGAW
ncbi:Flp family type IVb pilin [Pseudarthrobacter oxydans]|uniref:Flp family type IVb pilin n=1 Tax=Pseudarthrobacter oxydans TaxID=1671 RepID=UPI00381E9686